jgi:hypothetical protein
MSLAIAGLPRPPQTYAVRQPFGCDGEACLVSAWIRDQSQCAEETQCLEHGSVDADAHGMVAGFNASKGRPTGKGAFGNDFSRQAPTATGVTDIEPELAEGLPYGNRRAVGRGHAGTFVFR